MNVFLILIAILFWVSPSFADTHNAADCSNGAIQTAIDAAADGDIVSIPACSETAWTGDVTIPSSKGISLIGAGTINESNGTYSASGGTHINMGTNKLYIKTSPSNLKTRVSGIHFKHTDGEASGTTWNVQIQGDVLQFDYGSNNWRIDHNWFQCTRSAGGSNSALGIYGYTYGLVDNNRFDNHGRAIFIEAGDDSGSETHYGLAGMDTDLEGPIEWGNSYAGTYPKATFLEHNWAYGDGQNAQFLDANWSARVVIRYNQLEDCGYIQAHFGGTSGQYAGHGVVYYEVYENNLVHGAGATCTAAAMFFRSGTYIVYNNAITGTYASGSIKLDYRIDTGCDSPSSGNTYFPSQCGTPICRDQIGTGPDATSSGTNSQPAYFWGNTKDGSGVNPFVDTCGDGVIRLNTDYCNHSPATDCGSKAGWSYTAYTYPHPLKTGEEDTTAPIMSNPLPSGVQQCDAATPVDITLTLTTNENANCKYDTSDTTYALMANTYGTGQGTTAHSQVISLACDSSYTYYSRCQDTSPAQNTNTSSATHSFSIAAGSGDVTPPVMSNAGPTDDQVCTSNPRNVTLLVTATDETQTVACKYDTSDTTYDLMAGTFGTKTGNNFSHAVSMACGQNLTYYYRCADGVGTPNKNSSSSSANFNVLAYIPPGVTQAEDAVLVAPMASVANVAASGGFYIATTTEYTGTATFTLTAPATDTYRVVARVWGNDTGSDSFFVSWDGGTEYIWGLNPTFDSNYYNTWFIDYINKYDNGWVDPYLVSLTAGEHTLVVRGREVGARLDYLYLESVGIPPQPPMVQNPMILGSGGTFTFGVTGGRTFILQ